MYKRNCPSTRQEDTQGQSTYSSPSFLTSAEDGVEWSPSQVATLPPGKESPVRSEQKDEWAPKGVWALRRKQKSLTPAGLRTPVGPACRFSHYTENSVILSTHPHT